MFLFQVVAWNRPTGETTRGMPRNKNDTMSSTSEVVLERAAVYLLVGIYTRLIAGFVPALRSNGRPADGFVTACWFIGTD